MQAEHASHDKGAAGKAQDALAWFKSEAFPAAHSSSFSNPPTIRNEDDALLLSILPAHILAHTVQQWLLTCSASHSARSMMGALFILQDNISCCA